MPCKCLGAVDITVYRNPATIEGQKVKIFFDSKGVGYEDLDVTKDPSAMERMQTLSGQTERPVIVIDERVFVGFDPKELVHFVPSFF